MTGQLALITASVFAGAALYINSVEQPARLGLDSQALLTEWKPAYKRGTLMQGPLAMAGFLLGLLAWWQTKNLAWVIGGVLMLANWPVTLLVIMPLNRRLMATDVATPESRALIVRWGSLHAIRTALGFAAAAVFVWASYQS
ncbi:MAG: DUF1772 domain-containing protein [Alphaproteobacteria bacterium]|nr:DUF1772 domain-containing protein [Alphaproteobacteria bacterium]MBV9061833.1 DUF1772 domain-containing protein [Alphaproteobacteria bacterium]